MPRTFPKRIEQWKSKAICLVTLLAILLFYFYFKRDNRIEIPETRKHVHGQKIQNRKTVQQRNAEGTTCRPKNGTMENRNVPITAHPRDANGPCNQSTSSFDEDKQ